VDLRWADGAGWALGRNKPGMCPGDTGGFSRTAHPALTIGSAAAGADRRIGPANRGFRLGEAAEEFRVAIDSSPLEGAGRVEDTINLLRATPGPQGRSVCG